MINIAKTALQIYSQPPKYYLALLFSIFPKVITLILNEMNIDIYQELSENR